MATAVQKIVLSSAHDIPFNKPVLSQSTVRRIKAGVSVEDPAESIARPGLIQSLHLRAVLDAGGVETGMFEVPVIGRSEQSSRSRTSSQILYAQTPLYPVVGSGSVPSLKMARYRR